MAVIIRYDKEGLAVGNIPLLEQPDGVYQIPVTRLSSMLDNTLTSDQLTVDLDKSRSSFGMRRPPNILQPKPNLYLADARIRVVEGGTNVVIDNELRFFDEPNYRLIAMFARFADTVIPSKIVARTLGVPIPSPLFDSNMKRFRSMLGKDNLGDSQTGVLRHNYAKMGYVALSTLEQTQASLPIENYLSFVGNSLLVGTKDPEIVVDGFRKKLGNVEHAVLMVLIERLGQVVSKLEIHQNVWPNKSPSSTRVAKAVSMVRSRLGRFGALRGGFIRTVEGEGWLAEDPENKED